MPKPLLIIAITIAMLLPVQREAPSVVGARTFVSNEGRFSIALPGVTGFGSLTIPTPFDEAKGDLYQWRTREATFGIGYADASQPLDQPEVANTFFKSETERFNKAATSNSGSIAAVKQITLDKCPGIEQRVNLFTGTVIQRTYIVSRRIYEIVAVMTNDQKAYESLALGVLDSFKVLDEAEAKTREAENVAKAEPSALPQMPVTPRAGSDASDDGLRGGVKSVLTEALSGQKRKRESLDAYNRQGNLIRSEWYDDNGNVDSIKVYGYLDGSRVSKVKDVERDYNPPAPAPLRETSPAPPNAKKPDPRFQYRSEYKYDNQHRLIEETTFLNDGSLWVRSVYKYQGNQKEKLDYSDDGRLSQRVVYKLDAKSSVIEETVFYGDVARYKVSHAYEFDSKGNWTKRTTSTTQIEDGRERALRPQVNVRTITYY